MVYLGLGSNLGNRMENLRTAIELLQELDVFKVCRSSHVIETAAILLEGSPAEWDLPHLNMVISGTTQLSPQDLLSRIKYIEKKMGRDLSAAKWSPRIIDIDILSYYGQKIDEEFLKIPHPEIKNRDFLKYSLAEIGYFGENGDISSEDNSLVFENFAPLNHFVLCPKLVGIVNVTPDSFSDGGRFLDPDKAVEHISALVSEGATMVDLGAQSTRPGYEEVSAQEEIRRISGVLDRCYDAEKMRRNACCISLDTYFDDVLEYAIKTYPGLVKCANVQKFDLLKEKTIKMIAEKGLKIIIMLNGTDISWFEAAISKLEHCGVDRRNIIIDPGIGFQKSRLQNVEFIRNLENLRQFGCEIMLGHSRKSFMLSFSKSSVVAAACDRDLETIAISGVACRADATDYIRVHNVRDHMRFFVAEKMAETLSK